MIPSAHIAPKTASSLHGHESDTLHIIIVYQDLMDRRALDWNYMLSLRSVRQSQLWAIPKMSCHIQEKEGRREGMGVTYIARITLVSIVALSSQ